MRLLVLFAAVLLVVLAATLIVNAFRGTRTNDDALESTAHWQTHTIAADGVTTVVVRKVATSPRGVIEFGRQTIASIPDDDPEWDSKYHTAMAEARARVATLEIESQ